MKRKGNVLVIVIYKLASWSQTYRIWWEKLMALTRKAKSFKLLDFVLKKNTMQPS